MHASEFSSVGDLHGEKNGVEASGVGFLGHVVIILLI